MASNQVFYDEEECLGFGVFVAELELVIGTSKGRKPDQTVLLELLQKLQASIISTHDCAVLKQHQKRCEAALYDIIYKGACAAVSSVVLCTTTTAAAAVAVRVRVLLQQLCKSQGVMTSHFFHLHCCMFAGPQLGVCMPVQALHQRGFAAAVLEGQCLAGLLAGQQEQHSIRGVHSKRGCDLLLLCLLVMPWRLPA